MIPGNLSHTSITDQISGNALVSFRFQYLFSVLIFYCFRNKLFLQPLEYYFCFLWFLLKFYTFLLKLTWVGIWRTYWMLVVCLYLWCIKLFKLFLSASHFCSCHYCWFYWYLCINWKVTFSAIFMRK